MSPVSKVILLPTWDIKEKRSWFSEIDKFNLHTIPILIDRI